MRVFILDSNIIWSTAFNAKSKIGRFVLSTSSEKVKFYAPTYLKGEIEEQVPRVAELSGQSEQEVRETIQLAYTKVTFISDVQIPLKYYAKAAYLVRNIDMDDITFVALNEYFDELLWTGDMRLYNGLKIQGYTKVVKWEEVQKLVEVE